MKYVSKALLAARDYGHPPPLPDNTLRIGGITFAPEPVFVQVFDPPSEGDIALVMRALEDLRDRFDDMVPRWSLSRTTHLDTHIIDAIVLPLPGVQRYKKFLREGTNTGHLYYRFTV